VFQYARPALVLLAIAATPVLADQPIPVIGSYFRDVPCQEGVDRPDLLVTITRDRIESDLAVCDILNWERDGKSIVAHVECRVAGGQPLLGDVIFTARADGALEFKDQDRTSDAVLYRCSK
jgi:hypothetical protein